MTHTAKLPFVQRYLLVFIVLGAIWITLGKGFLLGTGGYLMWVMLFTVLPVLLIYGIATSLIARRRHKKSGYVFSRLTQSAAWVLLASLFVFGLTLVDGGDTKETISSSLTKLLGVSGANGVDQPLFVLSSTLANGSFWVGLLAMIVLLALVIGEGQGRK